MTDNVRNALARRVGYGNADFILSRFDVTPKGQAPADVAALIDALAQEAYDLYEDNSDDAYGAWSWLTEKARLMREGAEGAPRASQSVTEEQVLAALNAYNTALNPRALPAPALSDEDGDYYSLEQQDAMIAALEAAREAGRP